MIEVWSVISKAECPS